MKFLSLGWFKSKKEQPKAIEQTSSAQIPLQGESKPQEKKKPFRTVKLIQDTITILFADGSVISKQGASMEDFKKVRESQTEEDIFSVIADPQALSDRKKAQNERERIESIHKGFELLELTGDFEIRDSSVYLKLEEVSHRSLPEMMIEEFIAIIGKYSKDHTGEALTQALKKDDGYVGLKNFFMWACLSPRAEVAEKLYDFLKKNAFRITRQGFFTALRNVVSVYSQDNRKVEFISNAYNKIRAVWKKDPANYVVYDTEFGYEFHRISKVENAYEGNLVGNLKELYDDLPNMAENRFTDAYTHSFDIRVGRVVSMPIEQCRWNTNDCGASGLHFTSDEIHYVGCGDTSVLVLINPMKVVGIGTSKGRSYEYLPIMIVPREEATELLHDLDFDTLTLDEEYAIHELENLAEVAKQGFAAEARKHDFNIPQMSSAEVNALVASLSEMKEAISKRVSTIA